MFDDLLSIGDKIEITCINNFGKQIDTETQYISQLLDINNDIAKITLPIVNGAFGPLEIGNHYQLCFFAEKGLYECNCTVTDRYKENNIYVLEVVFTSDLEKVQRRKYYRYKCVIDLKYRLIDQNEIILRDLLKRGKVPYDIVPEVEKKIKEISKNIETGVAIDLSGGGLKFTGKKELKKDDMLIIWLPIAIVGKDELEIRAKIISVVQSEHRHTTYEYRVEFTNISISEREVIIRYIFELERKKRQYNIK